MTDYGTVTDYTTGTQLRPATAAEWRQTADLIAAGKPEGIFTDEDGTVVWVDGGPDAGVSGLDIAELEREAVTAGDALTVEACQVALGEPLTPAAFSDGHTYRVAGLGAELIAFFASPGHELAANGRKVAADGDDMLISGGALGYLAAVMSPDDDGSIADGSLWACGDPFPITRDDLTADEARALCAGIILDTRVAVAA